MSVTPFPAAKNPILCASKIDQSLLAHDCYEQLDAVALLAGMSTQQNTLSGCQWMMLLNPIVERLRLLTIMIDRHQSEAEIRLITVDDA
jgi:hypothetical protein